MKDINELYGKLTAKFPVSCVKFRPGATTADKKKIQALPYIPAACQADRLDEVFGFDNWEPAFNFVRENDVIQAVECNLKITIGDKKITRGNVASLPHVVGENLSETQREEQRRRSYKSANSDAFKRACYMLGIGRYLKHVPQIWVDAKKVGNNSYTFAVQPTLPVEFLPEDSPGQSGTNTSTTESNKPNESVVSIFDKMKNQIATATLAGLVEGEKWINNSKTLSSSQKDELQQLISVRQDDLQAASKAAL